MTFNRRFTWLEGDLDLQPQPEDGEMRIWVDGYSLRLSGGPEAAARFIQDWAEIQSKCALDPAEHTCICGQHRNGHDDAECDAGGFISQNNAAEHQWVNR